MSLQYWDQVLSTGTKVPLAWRDLLLASTDNISPAIQSSCLIYMIMLCDILHVPLPSESKVSILAKLAFPIISDTRFWLLPTTSAIFCCFPNSDRAGRPEGDFLSESGSFSELPFSIKNKEITLLQIRLKVYRLPDVSFAPP